MTSREVTEGARCVCGHCQWLAEGEEFVTTTEAPTEDPPAQPTDAPCPMQQSEQWCDFWKNILVKKKFTCDKKPKLKTQYCCSMCEELAAGKSAALLAQQEEEEEEEKADEDEVSSGPMCG